MKIGARGWLLIASVAAYFAVLWPAALRIVPEDDLWWMLPTMSHYLEGRSPWGTLLFLLDTLPVGFAQPTLKLFLYAVSRLFGPEVRWLLLASMVIQVGNAALLGLLARQWGLSVRIAAVSAVLFLFFFGHFHAVLWPTAAQHLLAVTTLLALLNLYFWTEGRVREGKWGAAAGFIGAGAAALAASMQRSTIIALAVMAADLVAFSRDAEERAARFRRWSWIFLLYALYPIVMVTSSGDPVVTEGLRKLSIPDWLRGLVVTDPLFPNSIPWGIRAAILIGFVLGGLGAVWAVLRAAPGRWLDRTGWRPWAAVGAGVLLLWCWKDHRQLLFPYSGSVPFLAPFSLLLDPLRAAFEMDSTEPYYYLAPQVSAGTLLLALAAIVAFWKTHLLRNRKLALLFVWYVVTLGVTLHQDSSHPLHTPSRYFIYLSPLAAIVVSCGLEDLAGWAARGRRERWREIALYGMAGLLCAANLAAIRVALFRGRLVNAVLFYDDFRTVRLIQDEALETQAVRVSGVVPMPIREVWRDFPLSVPPDYDNLHAAAAALGSIPLRGGEGAPQGLSVYRLEGMRVLSPLGRSIEPFDQLVQGGWNKISSREFQEASETFLDAVTRPPFLVRWLTEGIRISDLRWVTGGSDLNDWLERVVDSQREPGQPEPKKLTRVRELLQAELDAYARALVLLAYAHHRCGRDAESRYWLSQTQLLERDPRAIVHEMDKLPKGRLSPELISFLNRMEDSRFLPEAHDVKKEDYAAGRFLVRLILGWDIRSSWDRRFSKTL